MATRPVEESMKDVLSSKNVSLELGWEFRRDAPVPGQKSGPDCAAIKKIQLGTKSKDGLRRLLKVPLLLCYL